MVDFDESIAGKQGYTRFAGRVDVNDTVEPGDYNAYYIFELNDGDINWGYRGTMIIVHLLGSLSQI